MEQAENFIYLLLSLAILGGIIGIVFGVVASFVKLGIQLAPWIVAIVLIILFFQSTQ